MIAEAAIAGVTICFVACLRFTRYVIERSDPFAEKRRILERKLEVHIRNSTKPDNGTPFTDHHIGHGKSRDKVETLLLELADEEKEWHMR